MGSYVSLYFPHHDWNERPGKVTTDFRPPIDKGGTWEFVVETNLPGAPVELRWDNLESLPPSHNATLLDTEGKITVDLRAQDSYRFEGGGKRVFLLNIGEAKPLDRLSDGLPARHALHQNHPNPFNALTTISFDLARTNSMNISLYNVLGERVAVLADGTFPAGRHQLDFDAGDLSSGVYFYRMEAKQFVDVRKMVLMRFLGYFMTLDTVPLS